MNFEAKRASDDLAGEVAHILVHTWQVAYKGIMPEDYLSNISVPKRTERIRASILEGREEIYLFYLDGQPAGTAILNKYRDEQATDTDGEITAFYFLPEYWGRGCAKQAMDFCQAHLRQRGYTNIRLWVLEENARARRFYEKCGFRFDGGRNEIQIGKPLTDLCYQKAIG